jgi:hypothetical protein
MISLKYKSEMQYSNTKALLYGVLGVGDFLNLAPVQPGSNPNGITDPQIAYNTIIAEPPGDIGVFNENLGGSYVQPNVNAVPTLQNAALRMFEPNGTEKASNAAYTAAELAGSVILMILLPRAKRCNGSVNRHRRTGSLDRWIRTIRPTCPWDWLRCVATSISRATPADLPALRCGQASTPPCSASIRKPR